MAKREPDRVEGWRDKIARYRENGPAVARHGTKGFDALASAGGHGLTAASPAALAIRVGVPSKYIARSVAVLARYRLVTFDGRKGFSLVGLWPLPRNTKSGRGKQPRSRR